MSMTTPHGRALWGYPPNPDLSRRLVENLVTNWRRASVGREISKPSRRFGRRVAIRHDGAQCAGSRRSIPPMAARHWPERSSGSCRAWRIEALMGAAPVIDGPTALGHWRLSILDPTDAGAQPMARGGLWLVHNGEVYNYLELGAELRERGSDHHRDGHRGHPRRLSAGAWTPSRGSTGSSHSGSGTRAGEGYAGRDRMGVKPLYLRRTAAPRSVRERAGTRGHAVGAGRGHVDGRARPAGRARLPGAGLTDHSTATFLADVSVATAHLLIVEEGRIRHVRYWGPPALADDGRPASPATERTDEELVEEFRTTFDSRSGSNCAPTCPSGAACRAGSTRHRSSDDGAPPRRAWRETTSISGSRIRFPRAVPRRRRRRVGLR